MKSIICSLFFLVSTQALADDMKRDIDLNLPKKSCVESVTEVVCAKVVTTANLINIVLGTSCKFEAKLKLADGKAATQIAQRYKYETLHGTIILASKERALMSLVIRGRTMTEGSYDLSSQYALALNNLCVDPANINGNDLEMSYDEISRFDYKN